MSSLSRSNHLTRPPPIHIRSRHSNVPALIEFFNARHQERKIPITSASSRASRRISQSYDPLPPPNLVKSLVTSYNRLITIFGIRPTNVISPPTSARGDEGSSSAIENLKRNAAQRAQIAVLHEGRVVDPVPPLVETITVSGGDNRETTYHTREQVNSVKVWKGEREDYSAAERSVIGDGESTIAAFPEEYFEQPSIEERRQPPKPPTPTSPLKIKSRIKTPRTHSHNHGSWRTNAIGERYRPSTGDEGRRSVRRERDSYLESPPSSNEQNRSLSPGYRSYRPRTSPILQPQRSDASSSFAQQNGPLSPSYQPNTPSVPTQQRTETSSSSATHAPRLLISVSPRRPVSPILDHKTTAERSPSRTRRSPSPQSIPLPPSRDPAFRDEALSRPQLPKIRTPSPAPISPISPTNSPERGRKLRPSKSRPAFMAARQRFEELERSTGLQKVISLNVIPATASSVSSHRSPFSNTVEEDPDATIRATQPGNSITRPFPKDPSSMRSNGSAFGSLRSQRSQRRLSLASWMDRSEPTTSITSPDSQGNQRQQWNPTPQDHNGRKWSQSAKPRTDALQDSVRSTRSINSRMPGAYMDSREALNYAGDGTHGSIRSGHHHREPTPELQARQDVAHEIRHRGSGRFNPEYADATSNKNEHIRVSPLRVVKKKPSTFGSHRSSTQLSEVAVKPVELPLVPSVIRHRSRSRPVIDNTTFQTPPLSPPLPRTKSSPREKAAAASKMIQNQNSLHSLSSRYSETSLRPQKLSLRGSHSGRSPNRSRTQVKGYFAPRMHVRSDDEWMKGLQRRPSQHARSREPESGEISRVGMDGNNSILNSQETHQSPPESDIAEATADTAASSEIGRTTKPGRSHDRQGQNVSVLSSDVGGLRSDESSEETGSSDLTSSVQQRPSLRGPHVSFQVGNHLPFAGADCQAHELVEQPHEARVMGLDGPLTEPPSEIESLSDEPSSSEDHHPEFAPVNKILLTVPTPDEGSLVSATSKYVTAQEELSADDYPDEDEELARLRQGESSRAVRKKVQKFEQIRWREGAGRRRRKVIKEDAAAEGKRPWGWFGVRRITPSAE